MNRPSRSIRSLCAAAAALVGAGAVSACDASPYAASYNGHVISRAALNSYLRQWSANRSWVDYVQQQNASGSGSSQLALTGSGGSGTYSSVFAGDILGLLVRADIVHGYLAAHNQLPSQDELLAARAVNELVRSGYWDNFSSAVRQLYVQQLAEQAVLTPAPTDPGSLVGDFSQIQPYLFSQVCVRTASAFSASEAQRLASTGTFSGAQVCYDQPSFETQSPDFQRAVLGLTPGSVSQPIKTSYGYEVLQYVSRRGPGFSAGVQKVIAAATGSPAPVYDGLVAAAKVKVNPAYGSWASGTIQTPSIPGVPSSGT